MATTPSFTTAIQSIVQRIVYGIHTSLPGRVLDYDASKQTATVQPMLKALAGLPSAVKQLVDLPPIPNVPVSWPGGGGHGMHAPLAEGDQVLLVFCEHSIDRWQASNGENPVDAGDYNRGTLAGAVALPLIRTASQAWDSLSAGSGVRVGSDSGSFDAVAKAGLVEAELQAIIDAIANATPGVMDGGAALQTAIVAALVGKPGAVGADDVEVS